MTKMDIGGLDAVDEASRVVGWEHEVAFWREFMASERFIRNWCTKTPNPELQQHVLVFLRGLAASYNAKGRSLSILDIGSGPASILSRAFVGQNVELSAADPLGDDYAKLWTNGLEGSACRPRAVAGEKLVEAYGPASFDVTHIRNAIDHAAHPIAVLEQMTAITRPGGFVIVHGFENEAEAEKWEGFHQWNLSISDGDMLVTGRPGTTYRASEVFADKLQPVYVAPDFVKAAGRNWMTYIAQVKANPSRVRLPWRR